MTKIQILLQLKREIQELMGVLSIEEITANKALIRQLEIILGELNKTA